MPARTAPDVFDRWTPIWHAFFYVMIAVATAVVLGGPGPARVQIVPLVAALVAWHWLLIVRPGRGHRQRPRQVGVYLAGAGVMAALLVASDLTFLMVAMTLYNHVFAFLVTRYALPAALAVTAAIGLGVARSTEPAAIIVVAVCALGALVLGLYLSASARESSQRAELIQELERTREQLALAERLAGKTEERQRIGRELHDTVTQQLVGIVMHLEAAAGRDGDTVRSALERSLALAREGLAEARRLVWAERPAQLEEGSLTRALEATARRLTNETGLSIENDFEGEIDALPAAVQALVLRGVQEALANVRKHARARKVAVSVSASTDLLTVDVHDDGVGFDPGAAPREERGAGFGLRGLRERAHALGGTLSIESARDAGTTLALHVPLESA
jgi:signal transduction histidine kinase